MKIGDKKRSYPYSKGRVFFSAIITILSLVMAFTLLANQPELLLYYLLVTSLITIVTFLLKMRLYALISRRTTETEQSQTETDRTPWWILLLTFCTLVAFLIVPLVLARFLSPGIWVVLIVSLASGTSISEIVLYFSFKH